MGKHYLQFLGMFLLFAAGGFAQESEPILEEGFFSKDSIVKSVRLAEKEVYGHFRDLSKGSETGFVGGYVESIFHESIDSAIVQISVEGSPSENLIAAKGLFHLVHNRPGKHIEIQITHPDYHNFDTTFVLQNEGSSICFIRLVPRYKILIRGRVFAGKIPLEGVDVDLRFEGENYSLKTIGCFYDNENYWNCLFNGMFKKDLIAENEEDSIYISLNKKGMKTFSCGMRFREYSGEIMHFKMKYSSVLPYIPLNNLNLKLGFPLLSSGEDWFVGLSYYRLLNRNKLRRLGIGMEGDMYLSNVSVTYSTLPGQDVMSYDSSYVFGFVGPSVLVWIVKPERRYFSTYGGCTFSFILNNGDFAPQLFVGSRVFLDINKAISFEIRYTEFSADITNFSFNLYGNSDRYTFTEDLRKINFNLGVQVVF